MLRGILKFLVRQSAGQCQAIVEEGFERTPPAGAELYSTLAFGGGQLRQEITSSLLPTPFVKGCLVLPKPKHVYPSYAFAVLVLDQGS